jgi:hypothetical protein
MFGPLVIVQLGTAEELHIPADNPSPEDPMRAREMAITITMILLLSVTLNLMSLYLKNALLRSTE